MFKKILVLILLFFVLTFNQTVLAQEEQQETPNNTPSCSDIRTELLQKCEQCRATLDAEIKFENKDYTCRELITPIAQENVKYFYGQVNCSNIRQTSCQIQGNENPKLVTSDSESYDVNDEETGVNPTSEDSLFAQSVRNNGPILGPIYVIINLLTGIIATLTILAIVVGSFLMITGRGEETQITRGKEIIKNSIIALIIVLTSYTLIRLVQATIFQLINQ